MICDMIFATVSDIKFATVSHRRTLRLARGDIKGILIQLMRYSIGREITKNYYKILQVTYSWLPEVFLLSCKLLLLLHIKLVAPHYALFDNHEIAFLIFLNDWTLAEVLSSALSAMVRAFPTNDIPILMLFRTILGQTIMI